MASSNLPTDPLKIAEKAAEYLNNNCVPITEERFVTNAMPIYIVVPQLVATATNFRDGAQHKRVDLVYSHLTEYQRMLTESAGGKYEIVPRKDVARRADTLEYSTKPILWKMSPPKLISIKAMWKDLQECDERTHELKTMYRSPADLARVVNAACDQGTGLFIRLKGIPRHYGDVVESGLRLIGNSGVALSDLGEKGQEFLNEQAIKMNMAMVNKGAAVSNDYEDQQRLKIREVLAEIASSGDDKFYNVDGSLKIAEVNKAMAAHNLSVSKKYLKDNGFDVLFSRKEADAGDRGDEGEDAGDEGEDA